MGKDTCSFPSCNGVAKARGWCNTHYERWRLGRAMDAPVRPRWVEDRACAAAGCERPFHARAEGQAWCALHIRRVQRHGDPEAWKRVGEGHGMWAGAAVGYHGVHHRLYTSRGPAIEHACVDCGAAAKEWSYDGADLDERDDPKRGLFSVLEDHYQPRCLPCHKAYDSDLRRARGWTIWNKGPDVCSKTDCDRKAHARGLCSTHYNRWYNANRKGRAA